MSQTVRRSIEVEYWVTDEAGQLVSPGELTAAAQGVEREFVEPLLEIKTPPCETTEELQTELFDRLGAVLGRAEELGKRLVPLATPVNAGEIQELPEERTRIQNEVVGDQFRYVRHCAGTHIHFEQQPGQVVDQLNGLIALDPALALVNSSPYFQGQRLATGARSKLYRWMAYEDLSKQGRLWRYLEDEADWTRRLDRRYQEFLAAATEAGVDRQAVSADFDPESAVWTPVQIRNEFGTVEWRSPDTALPSHVLQLADGLATVVQRLVQTDVRIGGNRGEVTESAVLLPEFDAVLEYVEAAIRDGLRSKAVRSYLDRMGLDVASYEPTATRIDEGGAVDPHAARQLRLEYADRLEREVHQRSPAVAD